MPAKSPPAIPAGAQVLGVAGVAKLLGTTPLAVSLLRHRGLLLEPRWMLAARVPAWDRVDVEKWAREAGRLPT